jgi:rhodanese-related sulfurtransferase
LKFLIDNWPLILLAFVSGGMLLWPFIKGGAAGGGAVGTGEAVRLINREKGVLIDVCEPQEFAAGHAIGARNVPLAQLDGAKGLPTNKALPVLVLCATGARSARAAAQLRKAGYEKAVAVAGGNAAWREAQLPIEKGA